MMDDEGLSQSVPGYRAPAAEVERGLLWSPNDI